MKPLIWAGLLLSTAAGAAPECTQTDREHYVSGWHEAPAAELVRSRITPDSVIGCRFFPDPAGKLNVLARYEQGTLNGVGYRVQYSDGSGVIQGNADAPLATAGYQDNWKLTCRPSEGTPLYRCTLRKGDIGLQKDTGGHRTLLVGENHRKGSELLLRVDGQWAVTAPAGSGFTGEQTARLLTDMRKGRKADTRYHNDSVRAPTDRTVSLYGFAQAVDIMDTVLDQLKILPQDPRQDLPDTADSRSHQP